MIKVINNKPRASAEATMMTVAELANVEKHQGLLSSIKDNKFWRHVKDLRNNGSDKYNKERNMRHIARIPLEMYNKAIELWGKDVFTDKKKFKKYFLQKEGEWTLVVPRNSI